MHSYSEEKRNVGRRQKATKNVGTPFEKRGSFVKESKRVKFYSLFAEDTSIDLLIS